MKFRKILAMLLVLLLAGSAPAMAAALQQNSAMAQNVVAQVNAERAKYGMKPLKMSAALNAAAYVRAQEIVKKFGHTRPDGSKWRTVSKYAYAENIARGQKTVDKVMAAWLTSAGHRANILHAGYGSIGVCCVKYNGIYYWVQLFGK